MDERLLAAAKSGDAEGLGRWIAAGADVEAKSKNGWAAAMMAAYYGHEACIERLIGAGADIDAQDGDGWTAAIWAASNGQEDGVLVGLDETDRALIADRAETLIGALADAFGSRERAEKALLAWSAERVFPHVVTLPADNETHVDLKVVSHG